MIEIGKNQHYYDEQGKHGLYFPEYDSVSASVTSQKVWSGLSTMLSKRKYCDTYIIYYLEI